MPHDVPLIATIAVGLAAAFVAGFLATRLRLSPIIGYLLAGIAVGPFTPGFVADTGLASQLAEIGVILLMFGVGMHFSIRDLLEVRGIALPGAIGQIVVAVGLGVAATTYWGWPLSTGLVFGLALSVASTVVLIRELERRGALAALEGRIAVGWLVVEDLAMVVTLVLLPELAAGTATDAGALAQSVLLVFAKIAVFFVLMHYVGVRFFPWLFAQVARAESRELVTLFVIAIALGIAYASATLLHVSAALGAFFAGVMINESKLTARVAAEAVPLENAFAVLFFVSVGMLFDPRTLIDMPLEVLLVVTIIIVGKSLAALIIVLAFRYPLRAALTVSASLAQIGEFSFILATIGVSLGLLPPEGQSLILAGALLSITLNPFVFRIIDPVLRAVAASPRLATSVARLQRIGADESDGAAAQLRDHVVLAGFGRVGQAVAAELHARSIPCVIVDQNRDALRQVPAGVPVVFGDAANPAILSRANLERARLLVIAVPDVLRAERMLAYARSVNSRIDTAVRTHSDEELSFIEEKGVGIALMGERELANGLARYAVASYEGKGR